jgi:hypothetical protein
MRKPSQQHIWLRPSVRSGSPRAAELGGSAGSVSGGGNETIAEQGARATVPTWREPCESTDRDSSCHGSSLPLGRMKRLAPFLSAIAILVAGCRTVPDSTRTPAIGEWSDVADQMRGRLVVELSASEGSRTLATIYVELQNLAFTPYRRNLIFSRGSSCFTWKLTDVHKRAIPRWKGGLPWVYDFAEMIYPISLPARGTLRVPVAHVSYHILLPKFPGEYGLPSSSLVLESDPPNPPWHLVAGSSTEPYFLSAMFKSADEAKAEPHPFGWLGTLSLPPVRLPSDPSPRRHVW